MLLPHEVAKEHHYQAGGTQPPHWSCLSPILLSSPDIPEAMRKPNLECLESGEGPLTLYPSKGTCGYTVNKQTGVAELPRRAGVWPGCGQERPWVHSAIVRNRQEGVRNRQRSGEESLRKKLSHPFLIASHKQ